MLLINTTKPTLSRTNYYLKVEDIQKDGIIIKINQFHLLSEWPEDPITDKTFEAAVTTITPGQTFKWHKPILGTSDDWEIKLLEIK